MRTSRARGSPTFALRIGLLLDHRLCRSTGSYRVCVPVQDLSIALFGSKDHRNLQSDWGDILTSADLGLCPLYPHYVGKIGGYVPLYDLEANVLAISELRCAALIE